MSEGPPTLPDRCCGVEFEHLPIYFGWWRFGVIRRRLNAQRNFRWKFDKSRDRRS
jgi:hypothetical protein